MHFLPFSKTSMSINMHKKYCIKIKVLYCVYMIQLWSATKSTLTIKYRRVAAFTQKINCLHINSAKDFFYCFACT